jgi:hypothetical protein
MPVAIRDCPRAGCIHADVVALHDAARAARDHDIVRVHKLVADTDAVVDVAGDDVAE